MKTIEIKDIVKRYKELVALDHLSLEVNEGEILGLLGPNGCGKSTVINCMLGLLTFDKGSIRVLGEENFPLSAKNRGQIGIVPQELAYLENLTVRENIDFFCGLYVNDPAIRKQYVDEAIRFTGLEDFQKFLPKKLSGGLKRRLNIACGISHKPTLIFFDEPTVAVDTQSRNFILEGIRQLNEQGATIIYTTHYLEEVDSLCDRIVIMDKGRNIVSGTTIELKESITTKEKIHVELLEEVTEDLRGMVNQLPHVALVEVHKQTISIQFEKSGNLLAVGQLLEDHHIHYLNLFSERPSLDDVFLAYTGKGLRD